MLHFTPLISSGYTRKELRAACITSAYCAITPCGITPIIRETSLE
jgi:hypothetical protein